MLVDHRLQPYAGMVGSWDGTDSADWQTNNLRFATHFMMVKAFSTSLTNPFLSTAVSTMRAHGIFSGAWTYNIDEPAHEELPRYEAGLAAQKAAAPTIRTMVTGYHYPGLSIDIYCAPARNIGNGKPLPSTYAAAGKSLWMYVSCMSHGCGVNRAGSLDPDANDTLHPPDGEPDLVIDRTAVEAFGLYLMGYKYGLESLLYYNSIEGWSLWAKSPPIDVWTDQYNFGGNGDGTLLYPDRANKLPRASIRLKLLREASYMVDALEQVPDQSWAHAQVDALVRTTLNWDRDMARISALRNAALERLK